jgi:cell cycle sensor histidine kinase DivJ
MRNLMSLVGIGRDAADGRDATSPVEAARRQTLAGNSRFIVALSVIGMPAALFGLAHGSLLPFVLTMFGLATGVMTLRLQHDGRFETAASGAGWAVMLAGLVLTLADPAPIDFGLALVLLAPIHAALLSRASLRPVSWAIFAGVDIVAALGSAGLLRWPEAYQPNYALVAALIFLVVAALLTRSARRLNTAIDKHDRTQTRALRNLIDHVQESVVQFSGDGRLVFASLASERLFGCRRFELKGRGLFERVHLLDRPVFMTAFADANTDGRSRKVEIRMRRDRKDAPGAAPHYIWVEASFSPMVEKVVAGTRHDVVAMLRDVSERRDHEDEMVRARTKAEDASNAKSRFLATIGHELRTPLNAIVGFSEMMTSGVAGDLSPQQREYATLIYQSGQHLIDIVRMLLDMSRIEAGRFELNTEPFSPDGLVAPCFKMVDALARDRQVRLESELDRDLPAIVADERACRQILINLLSNAVKFSHEQSVVTLAMKRQGTHLRITVTDRGIGMDADSVRRIGEPFFQAQDGLSRRYEGTGLGLSIVKGLVELHGGTLEARSRQGEGTAMTVLLPINGPETKLGDTEPVTPLRRQPVSQHMSAWPDDERRKAQ